jgi:hypothetical protein
MVSGKKLPAQSTWEKDRAKAEMWKIQGIPTEDLGSCPSSVKMPLKTPAKLQNIDNKANNNVMHGYRL